MEKRGKAKIIKKQPITPGVRSRHQQAAREAVERRLNLTRVKTNRRHRLSRRLSARGWKEGKIVGKGERVVD